MLNVVQSVERCCIMVIFFHRGYLRTVFVLSTLYCDIFVAGYIKSHVKF